MWNHFFCTLREIFFCIFFHKNCADIKNKSHKKITVITLFFIHQWGFLKKLWSIGNHRFALWLHRVLSIYLAVIFRFWRAITTNFHYRPYGWEYLRSNSIFLLAVRPKPWQIFRKKSSSSSHFPPPGYGIPPGHENLVSADNYHPSREYALYLLPGRLIFWFLLFGLVLPWFIFGPLKGSNVSYLLMILIYMFFSVIIYYVLFIKLIPPSLANVWKKWPIPAYGLFLSVPHSVSISRCDQYTVDEKEKGLEQYKKIDQYIFWRPDVKSPLWRQSTEYLPDMQKLQELVLSLALFELLFHKKIKSKRNKKIKQDDEFSSLKTLHEMRWYSYLFAPIWINLFLISLSLLFFVSLKVYIYKPESFHLIANFPYNFIFAVSSWYIFTVFYSVYILNYLKSLSENLRKGAFKDKLHLIPAQILDELSYIPSHREVEAAMHHLRKTLGWISSVVFIALMSILEVLSQAFGNSHIIFNF